MICLCVRIQSLLQGFLAKETYNFKEPTNRRHPMYIRTAYCIWSVICVNLQSQSRWDLFNGTWQNRHVELDYRLRVEIEEMTIQRQQAVRIQACMRDRAGNNGTIDTCVDICTLRYVYLYLCTDVVSIYLDTYIRMQACMRNSTGNKATADEYLDIYLEIRTLVWIYIRREYMFRYIYTYLGVHA